MYIIVDNTIQLSSKLFMHLSSAKFFLIAAQINLCLCLSVKYRNDRCLYVLEEIDDAVCSRSEDPGLSRMEH